LESVLRQSGAKKDPADPHKWHTGYGVLSVTGAKFMNWSRGTGGGGAIDLAIHLNRLGFQETLQWLEKHFPDPTTPGPPLPKPGLKLPDPDPACLWRVQCYLIDQRGLAPFLVGPLIQSGALYADSKANAVFLLRDSQNLPVGAELRGTTASCWRGMAPGSRKDLGFFSIPAHPLQSIILCESAIDAISCFALHPGHRCLSTAGARPNPIWLTSLIANAHKVYCGFDADPTGDLMANAMIALHPSVIRLRPTQKDWNDVLNS
jgi:hypothetical protein